MAAATPKVEVEQISADTHPEPVAAPPLAAQPVQMQDQTEKSAYEKKDDW